ncbi:DUF1648 domain-containing protein [Paenibacillus eucommiae]|uniref:Membrane protein n=1 Tax=Paenibacillus eucommiae TaxID=1355755 RepID=A0ABS4IY30_9BACL|nr:DUF1648 domain-containing protein [Paenibacillus eucommiae]MBP1991454.1 putative membrane protein [Paenibacillus eucommiae]
MSLIVLVGIIGYLFSVWSQLPEQVPQHYNAAGEVDKWGGRGVLFPLPILSALLYAGQSVLSKFPQSFNYLSPVTEENAPRQYITARMMISWLKLQLVVLFSYIEWDMIQSALGKSGGLGLWFLPVTLVVVFGTIIFYAVRSVRIK